MSSDDIDNDLPDNAFTFFLSKSWVNLLNSYVTKLRQNFGKVQKQPPEVFCEKGVLINFTKFIGNTCARVSFLVKLQALEIHRCFPLNFAKLLRTLFLQNTYVQMLLKISKITISRWKLWSKVVQKLWFVKFPKQDLGKVAKRYFL